MRVRAARVRAAGAALALALAGLAAAAGLADTSPPPVTTVAPPTASIPVPISPDPAPTETKPAPKPTPRAKPKPKPVAPVVVTHPSVQAQPPPPAAPVYRPPAHTVPVTPSVAKPHNARRVKHAAAPTRSRTAHRPIDSPSRSVTPKVQHPAAAPTLAVVAAPDEVAATARAESPSILLLLEIALAGIAVAAILFALAVPALAGGPTGLLRLHRGAIAMLGIECAALAAIGRFIFG